MTNGSLMQGKSIAECNNFDLHETIIGLENQFVFFFYSGRFCLSFLVWSLKARELQILKANVFYKKKIQKAVF